MMDADDPIAQQQQQQLLDQQRRQQDQLRRQQEQSLREAEAERQIIEDEERERLKDGKPEMAEGASKSNSKGRWRLFGKKSADTDVPHRSKDSDKDDSDSGVVTGSSQATSGSTSIWLVGVLAVCLAGFFGYRSFMPSVKTKTAQVAPQPKSTALPTAEPGSGLSDPQGPQIDINGDLVPVGTVAVSPASAASPVVAQTSTPAPSNAMADPVEVAVATVTPAPESLPATAASAPASAEVSSLQKLDMARREPVPDAPSAVTAPKASTPPAATAPSSDMAALEARIQALEEQIKALRPAPPSAVKHAAVKQSKPARSKATDTRQVARADKPSPAPTKAPAQLLAVDLWDGRPSVVIGTGARGDKRTRVLQPGESFNGIALQSVDVANQRATFSTGTGSVTMEVK